MLTDNSDFLSIRKVIWRNGDVISQDHFQSLEAWIERLLSSVSSFKGYVGLFRLPDFQNAFNDEGNVRLSQVNGLSVRVEVENMQGLNRFGEFLKITNEKVFDINLRTQTSNLEGPWYLYLTPASDSNHNEAVPSSDPTTGVELYEQLCTVRISNEDRRGIVIGRLCKLNDTIELEKDYIPQVIFIDSHPKSLAAWENLRNKFLQWKTIIDEYLPRLKPAPEVIHAWMLASAWMHNNEWFQPLQNDPHKELSSTITEYQQFFNVVKSSLKIFMRELEIRGDEFRRQRTVEQISVLEQPWFVSVDGQAEQSRSFQNASDLFDQLIGYSHELPIAKELPSDVRITSVDGPVREVDMNKFVIKFEKEITLKKEKSSVTVELREFSKAEPLKNLIRCRFGSVIFAQMEYIHNIIKKKEGEPFTYTIELSPELIKKFEIIKSEKATQLSIYLPPPLGDGVQNLKSHIRLSIRD